MCKMHYNREWRLEKGMEARINMAKDLVACVGCGRTIRPRRGKAEDFPNTVTYGSKDKCTTCYKATRVEGDALVNREREARNLAHIEQGLTSYLNRRRERLSKYRLAA